MPNTDTTPVASTHEPVVAKFEKYDADKVVFSFKRNVQGEVQFMEVYVPKTEAIEKALQDAFKCHGEHPTVLLDLPLNRHGDFCQRSKDFRVRLAPPGFNEPSEPTLGTAVPPPSDWSDPLQVAVYDVAMDAWMGKSEGALASFYGGPRPTHSEWRSDPIKRDMFIFRTKERLRNDPALFALLQATLRGD